MTAIAADPVAASIDPGYRGLLAFCEAIEEPLEPHEKRIARAHFGEEREVYAILPRGNLKTSLAAKIGLHHLLTVPYAAVTIGAASRDQARISYERMRGFAQHPALDDQLTIRHLELRHENEEGLRLLRVVVSEGPRVHGLSSSLYIGDEIWAWRGDDLLEAMLTGLVKRPDARFLGISTAAAVSTRRLAGLARERWRARSAARARSSMPSRVACAGWNGASPRTSARRFPRDQGVQPREQHHQWFAAGAVPARDAAEFPQFHCCQWGVAEGPGCRRAPGAPARRVGARGRPRVLGVDIGGSRAASAVVRRHRRATGRRGPHFRRQRVGSWTRSGEMLFSASAERRPVIELCFDP